MYPYITVTTASQFWMTQFDVEIMRLLGKKIKEDLGNT
jgi:hypothetical protein